MRNRIPTQWLLIRFLRIIKYSKIEFYIEARKKVPERKNFLKKTCFC